MMLVLIKPSKNLRPLPLCNDAHTTHIGTLLNSTDNMLVSQTLAENVHLFVRTICDMSRVSLDIITHHFRSIKKHDQSRKMGEEKHNATRKEANNIVKADFIKKKHSIQHGWQMWLW